MLRVARTRRVTSCVRISMGKPTLGKRMGAWVLDEEGALVQATRPARRNTPRAKRRGRGGGRPASRDARRAVSRENPDPPLTAPSQYLARARLASARGPALRFTLGLDFR